MYMYDTWRRKWQPTPAFLPGEFHAQRSLLAIYSPWGHKESDMTEQPTHTHAHKNIGNIEEKKRKRKILQKKNIMVSWRN